MNAGVIIFVLLLVLAFLGLPIYLSIGIATMVAMLHAGFPLEAVAQKTFLGMNSSSLLCIPLFILAGNIMAQGITQKLINAANVPLGRVRGSLARQELRRGLRQLLLSAGPDDPPPPSLWWFTPA